jgi:PAS domain S-box-containing protein
MGRATSQPGLFLSVPVGKDQSFAGIIMGKFDTSSLASWLSFTDAFIADDNGVVIFARNPHFLLHYLNDSAAPNMAEGDVMALYKQPTVNRLPSLPWHEGNFADVFSMEGYDDPVIIVTAPLSIAEGLAGVVRPVPQILMLEQERWRNFEIVGGLGALVGLLLYAAAARAGANGQALQAARTELSLQHSVIDSAGMAMAIYSRQGVCAGVNEAMARIFASTRSQMLHANLFDHDVWVDSGLVTIATQVLDSGTMQRGKWRIAPTGGKERWVDATFRRIQHDGADYLLAIFADVTESQWRNPNAAQ